MAPPKRKMVIQEYPLDGLDIDPGALRLMAARAVLPVKGVDSLAVDRSRVLDPESPDGLEKAVILQQKGQAFRYTVRINAVFGTHLEQLSALVQKAVREAVNRMTGFEVDSVRVVVSGITAGAATRRATNRRSAPVRAVRKTSRKKK